MTPANAAPLMTAPSLLRSTGSSSAVRANARITSAIARRELRALPSETAVYVAMNGPIVAIPTVPFSRTRPRTPAKVTARAVKGNLRRTATPPTDTTVRARITASGSRFAATDSEPLRLTTRVTATHTTARSTSNAV